MNMRLARPCFILPLKDACGDHVDGPQILFANWAYTPQLGRRTAVRAPRDLHQFVLSLGGVDDGMDALAGFQRAAAQRTSTGVKEPWGFSNGSLSGRYGLLPSPS
jgi:hypothetical protein